MSKVADRALDFITVLHAFLRCSWFGSYTALLETRVPCTEADITVCGVIR